jgi:hypothetical protein
MSWYVETLLRNRESIHASTVKRVGEYGNHFYVDLTGNDYNNLLILEKNIDALHKAGNISDREVHLINLVSTNKSFRELEKDDKQARHSLAKNFHRVCEKLAFILGGEFTDEGYLSYIKRKHNLDEKQLELAKEYMLRSSLD